ncbi:MAG: diguanylate cyclase [Paraglaciecola sp.]|uniref:histidine kinase N-terminal 7TM domain-containing diguanylate cyclase n=1 Tax=Paraglaciecola sp. TaxID=1920173 RepID=UPI00273DEC98|nr:GGDEF domain-containing protein [Paraglaciecola sp.]MDP5032201.1 diguanylate cyclase [Paraglaciecola sp.]MDP5133097.1 diguanylate cyclase [Paraglaciecola sp.]
MVQVLSLPLFITASISLILSIFFILLYFRLKFRYEESVRYYLIFALAALTSSIFFSAFAVLVNSADNLNYLNVANRLTVISAMFTIVLSLHFYIAFFQYKAPILLKWCYAICACFSILAVVPNQYFLSKAFYSTSQYYTGLMYGPLFQMWGAWILILAMYCIFILVNVYVRQRRRHENGATSTVQLLLLANLVWMITGVSDTFTGIQVIDFPPLTWIGSFLVTCSIAWILVLHIDKLYEERRQLNNRLMYDHLTQAFSRSFLEIRLTDVINSISRNKLHGLSVCVFDVDNFKTINDQYGHANGDELLRQITTIIKENIRPSDCIARLGGDEFVILLPDNQQENNAVMIIERIRKHISESLYGIGDHKFNASCSFGIVSATAEHLHFNDLPHQLLSCADEALYSAKHQGKNAIGVATLSDLS